MNSPVTTSDVAAPIEVPAPGTNHDDAASKEAETARVAEWVSRAQAGDEAAFEAIVRHFERRIFNLAYRMLNRYEDAADVSQEIFVKLYKAIGQFEGRSKFSTWFFALAVNMCRNRIRTQIRLSVEKQILDAPVDDEDGRTLMQARDESPGPREQAQHHEIRAQVERAIAELPVEFREAVVLRELQHMSYDEVAETLGVSIGTVKSRIARGRGLLKEKLEPILKS